MNPLLILLAGLVVVVGGVLWLRLHAFLALLLGSFVVAILTPRDSIRAWAVRQGMDDSAAAGEAAQSVADRIAEGFGSGCEKIGILIAMASIIGKCLLDSGGAARIVDGMRRGMGERRAPMAFTASGFLLGIPVFFDTVFYLLMPLGRALRKRTGKDYLFYIMAIVSGATMAHSLVPPTPGPLFVASELGVDVGAMMVGGLTVGLFTVSVGYAYASWANKRWVIPLRAIGEGEESIETSNDVSSREELRELPPLWAALFPIVLPLVLIGGERLAAATGIELPEFLEALGNKNYALTLSAAAALVLLATQCKLTLSQLSGTVQKALMAAGVIILITASGSAFGGVLRQTGIDSVLTGAAPGSGLGILVLAFGATMLVRIAQGSATVAMITAVGIIAPLVGSVDLPFHGVYVALAIGCGSKPIMWMNDSGFWIISRMTGMTEGETLKTASAMMALMGFSGLFVVLLGATFLPFR